MMRKRKAKTPEMGPWIVLSRSLWFAVAMGCGAAASEATVPPSQSNTSSPGATEEGSALAPEGEQPVVDSEPGKDELPKEEKGPSVKSQRTQPEPGSSLEQLMQAHFEEAEIIRSAVIAGKPELAAQPAQALEEMSDIQDLPKDWVEPVKRMQKSASLVGESADVVEAAAATADIGTSCGWCHRQLGGPLYSVPTAPKGDDSVVDRMKLHSWAVERLWEGLYVPSDQAWTAGTNVLKNDPFPENVLSQGGVYARTAAKDFSRIVDEASREKTVAGRAAVYAKLLGTCAVCHIAIND